MGHPTTWEGEPTDWVRDNVYRLVGDTIGSGEGKARYTKWTPPSDLEVEVRSRADISGSGSSEAQAILRWTSNPDNPDLKSYYFGGIGAWGHKAAIGKIVDNVSTLIAYNDGVIEDKEYEIKFKAVGDKLFLYIDNKLECWVTDTDIEAGWTGLRTWNSKIMFDNYYVKDINGAIIAQDKFGDYLRDTSFYIVNREASPITLSSEATDIDPVELVDNMDIYWDLNNSIQPGQSQRVNLTMEVMPEAPIGDFFFNITVRGNLT